MANVGRWVFAGAKAEPALREHVLLADDFRLRVDAPGAAEHGRDLFRADGGERGVVVSAKSAFPVKHAVKPVPTPAPAPGPDAAQVNAEAGLGRLRLLGVVFHGGKRQAYLGQDRENCIASAGDTVFGQYMLDAVNVDAVELRDIKSNITRRIPVSGK